MPAPSSARWRSTPAAGKFHYNLGLCHFHGRRYAQSVDALRAARAAGEKGAIFDYNLGRALALAGRCPEAIGELTAAMQALRRPDRQGRDADGWFHLGTCQADEGRLGEAIEAFREVLARAPGHQKSLYRLGAALRRANRTGAAEVETLFQARQPADEAIRSMRLAGLRGGEQRLRLGRLQLEAGLPGHALVDLDMVLASRPRHAEALVLAGRASLGLRPPDLERAERSFGQALQANPRDPDALAGLGEALRWQGQLAAAEARFKEALVAQPESLAAAVGRARVTAAGGRYSEAIAELEATLARASGGRNEAEVLRALAELHTASAPTKPAKPEEALRLLDRARSLYGEDAELRVRAHLARGDRDAARVFIEQSPFLDHERRGALGGLTQAK